MVSWTWLVAPQVARIHGAGEPIHLWQCVVGKRDFPMKQ